MELIDVFVSGVAEVEVIQGDLLRITYYVDRPNSPGGREIVLSIVMPACALATSREVVANALDRATADTERPLGMN